MEVTVSRCVHHIWHILVRRRKHHSNSKIFPLQNILTVFCLFGFFKDQFIFRYMNTPQLSDTPEEGIRPRYRWLWATMWLLGTELRTSGRAVSALNREPSFQPTPFLLEIALSLSLTISTLPWLINAAVIGHVSPHNSKYKAKSHNEHFYKGPCRLLWPLWLCCLDPFPCPQRPSRRPVPRPPEPHDHLHFSFLKTMSVSFIMAWLALSIGAREYSPQNERLKVK